jgi:hypothetical protein
MIALGSAFQEKGLGAWLWCSMKRLMASWSANQRGEGAALQAAPREPGEEALDRVQPGA